MVESAVSHRDCKAEAVLSATLTVFALLLGRQVGREGTSTTPSPFGQLNQGEKEDRLGLLTLLSVFFIYFQETSILQCGSGLLYGAEQFWNPPGGESQERGCLDSEQSIANVSGLIRSTEGALEKAWAPFSISEVLTGRAPVSRVSPSSLPIASTVLKKARVPGHPALPPSLGSGNG